MWRKVALLETDDVISTFLRFSTVICVTRSLSLVGAEILTAAHSAPPPFCRRLSSPPAIESTIRSTSLRSSGGRNPAFTR